jgi:hypothetical protein
VIRSLYIYWVIYNFFLYSPEGTLFLFWNPVTTKYVSSIHSLIPPSSPPPPPPPDSVTDIYESVSKSIRTGRLERELQMVQLSATRCSCIAILWVSILSFPAITLCVASQRVFIIVSVYFFMTQSGNFWIRLRYDNIIYLVISWTLWGLLRSQQKPNGGCVTTLNRAPRVLYRVSLQFYHSY